MMGGNFGRAAGALLLFPVLIAILVIGAALGAGGIALMWWLF